MPQETYVKLRFKFVLPINLILLAILGASLAWEWWRLERNELGMLRTRLDEEERFVHAAAKTLVALGLEILTRHLESCVLGHVSDREDSRAKPMTKEQLVAEVQTVHTRFSK